MLQEASKMTSLAQQLQRLAVPQARAAAAVQRKERKSLLFEPAEAAGLDRDTFYAIGKSCSLSSPIHSMKDKNIQYNKTKQITAQLKIMNLWILSTLFFKYFWK